MSTTGCQCFEPGARVEWAGQSGIGVTADFWDISHMRCARCGTPWLRGFLEIEAFSRSGRFYRAPVTDAALAEITPDAALRLIEEAPLRIAGGSRFDGVEHVISGPGKLMVSP